MGLKKIFKRLTPHHSEIRNHRHLVMFGEALHDPNLWHITRHSAAGGIANGLFWAFMPVPGQTVLAALLAVWLTNPLTFYPIYFAAYKTGSLILNQPHQQVDFAMNWEWFSTTMTEIWEPLILGCLVLGGLSAVVGYFAIRMLWRFAAIRKWEERKERMRMRKLKQKHTN